MDNPALADLWRNGMTPEQFKTEMEQIERSGDTEGGHVDADELMCRVLRELGYGDGVEVFERMDRWYA